MSTLTIPNTIANGDTTDAVTVQQNFDAIETFVNADVVKKDGSTTLTGALILVAADPTLANHATRKSYVDTAVAEFRRVVTMGIAGASATLTLTSSYADVVGATSGALTLVTGDIVEVHCVADVNTLTAASVGLVTLDVNGTQEPRTAIWRGATVADRGTIAQTWMYSVPSSGSYTFKLVAKHGVASGVEVLATQTAISWKAFR